MFGLRAFLFLEAVIFFMREPVLEDFHGENVAPRKIVVKREHLAPEVRVSVDALRLQRKKRLGLSIGIGLFSGGGH